MWIIFAILSAVFAALTSILAKIGIDGVNSNLATAIRTVVVVVMAWGMVFLTHAESGIKEISSKSWIFLILSGLATGASWLCYYKALQMGEASKVVPIDKLSVVITLILAFVFLHEEFTIKSVIGCVLIAAGTLVYRGYSIRDYMIRYDYREQGDGEKYIDLLIFYAVVRGEEEKRKLCRQGRRQYNIVIHLKMYMRIILFMMITGVSCVIRKIRRHMRLSMIKMDIFGSM